MNTYLSVLVLLVVGASCVESRIPEPLLSYLKKLPGGSTNATPLQRQGSGITTTSASAITTTSATTSAPCTVIFFGYVFHGFCVPDLQTCASGGGASIGNCNNSPGICCNQDVPLPTLNPNSTTLPPLTTPSMPTMPTIPAITTPSLPTIPTISTPSLPTLPGSYPTIPGAITLPASYPTIPGAITLPASYPTLPGNLTLPPFSPTMPGNITLPGSYPTLPGNITLPESYPTPPAITLPPISPTIPGALTLPPVPALTTSAHKFRSERSAEETVKQAPPVPTLPPSPEITYPAFTAPPGFPSMTTPGVPTFPSMTTPAYPALPSMTTPAYPALPSMTTPAYPTLPEITTPTIPAIPTLSTPGFPAYPSMTTPPLPAYPTITTPAYPTLPSLTPPTLPAFPNITTPTIPAIPTLTTPAYPAVPSAPTIPPPPVPNVPPINTPTVGSPQVNVPEVAVPVVNVPNVPVPAVPTISSNTPAPPAPKGSKNIRNNSVPVDSNTGVTNPPNPVIGISIAPEESGESSEDITDSSIDGSSFALCRKVTKAINSVSKNPSYPSPDKVPKICQHIVIPANGTCAVRYEFLEANLEGRLGDSCYTDNIQIINSDNTPASPQCGLLTGYQITVKAKTAPVILLITTQSESVVWNIKVTQIRCSQIKSVKDLEPEYCGRKGSHRKRGAPRPAVDTPKKIPASRLLKPKKDPLKDVYLRPSAPENLLQKFLMRNFSTKNLKIVRGNETGINEWPWQALLMIAGRPLCGGALINHEWLITAGHCASLSLRFPMAALMVADLGDHDLRTTAESANKFYQVSKIVPHIQHQVVFNDIALIKLATKVEFTTAISPVCLPYAQVPESTYIGRKGMTTGWGKTESSVISPVLRQVELEIMSLEDCRTLWELVGEGGGDIIDSNMICAGGGEVGPCNGDSGGPFVVQDPNNKNKWDLVGVTSFGSLRGCALPGVPSVFTRISNFLDFIAMNLAEP